MKYEEMSDQQINHAVGMIVSRDNISAISATGEVCVHDFNASGVCISWKVFDPCNSWADAGPIIQENKISLHALMFGDGWMAEYTGHEYDVNDCFEVDHHEAHDRNPRRAGLIVFLMMKEADNG